MLPPNVTASLDNLSRLGILDYDAAADIAGSRPRYYGQLRTNIPPIAATPLDSFSYSDGTSFGSNPFSFVHSPLFGFLTKAGVLLGGLYLGGKAFLLAGTSIKNFKLTNPFKNWFKNNKKDIEEMEKSVKRGFKKGKKKFKRGLDGIRGKESAVTKIKNFFGNIFSRKKIRIK